MSIDDLFSSLKARGNWGHSGRPGKRGGSAPKGSSSSFDKPGGIDKAANDLAKHLGASVNNTMSSSTASGRIEVSGDKTGTVSSYLQSQGYKKTAEKVLDNGKREVYTSTEEPRLFNVEYNKNDNVTTSQAYYVKDWKG